MVFPLSDNDHNVVHVETEVLTVRKELISYFGDVLSQVFQVRVDVLVGHLATWKYVLVISARIKMFSRMSSPLALLRVVVFVFVISWGQL